MPVLTNQNTPLSSTLLWHWYVPLQLYSGSPPTSCSQSPTLCICIRVLKTPLTPRNFHTGCPACKDSGRKEKVGCLVEIIANHNIHSILQSNNLMPFIAN